jgi:catechol 2,3-dioxygenase-like lactoylglutathione lyase family enzyme
MGYESIANKNESYEICFVPDNDYRGFLKRRMPNLEAKVDGGLFVDTEGNKLGTHKGYPFYTIGQRKGLGAAFGKPMFVTRSYPKPIRSYWAKEKELNRNGMWVGKLNMQKYATITDRTPAITKVRYKHDGESSLLFQKDDRIKVEFMHEVSAIAPGQSAVFYEGNDVIGGGKYILQLQYRKIISSQPRVWRVIEIQLLSNDLKATSLFYSDILGFKITYEDDQRVSFSAGTSALTFIIHQKPIPAYHFAFNIPPTALEEALQWAKQRTNILSVGDREEIANFDSWNAKAFYFIDNNGNILEFIARFNLKDAYTKPFGSESGLIYQRNWNGSR